MSQKSYCKYCGINTETREQQTISPENEKVGQCAQCGRNKYAQNNNFSTEMRY